MSRVNPNLQFPRLVLAFLYLGICLFSEGGIEKASANGETPRGSELVEIKVPTELRQAIVSEAINFCVKTYPSTPSPWFEKQYKRYLENETWKIDHLASYYRGPMVTFEGKVKVTFSFPDISRYRRITNYSRNSVPNEQLGQLDLETAFSKADAIRQRAIHNNRLLNMPLREKQNIQNWYYDFVWSAPSLGDFNPEDRIDIEIDVKMGRLKHFAITSVRAPSSDRPLIPREEIEKKLAELKIPEVHKGKLSLYAWQYLGETIPCWHYKQPDSVRSDGQDKDIFWDAYSGDIISSNLVDGQGRHLSFDKTYRSEKQFPYRTEEQIVAQLNKMVQARVAELRQEKKDDGKEEKPAPAKRGGWLAVVLIALSLSAVLAFLCWLRIRRRRASS